MEYRNLGEAGVKVSPLCLGCMNFGWRAEEEESIRIIREALDAGINFLDTANIYARGVSETVVGKALQGRREGVVIATKVRWRMGDGPNDSGYSRLHVMQQIEGSLRRLQTDHVDLYQLHAPDDTTPIEEVLGTLDCLVRQGKVRYIGTSNFPAWQICEALWVSDRRNWQRSVSEQPYYSILGRGAERELLPFCSKHGVGAIPYSPLAGGWLTGKYRKGQEVPADSRGMEGKWDMKAPDHERRLEAVERLIPLAQECGATLSQFSLAWMLMNPAVTSPIIGPRTVEQLRDNLGALEVKLDEDVLKKVDEIVPPRGQV